MDKLLIITATVFPRKDAPRLTRSDPADRTKDYRDAFAFYADLLANGTFDRIIFAENSGASDILSDIALHRGVQDHYEFVPVMPDGEKTAVGRFCGEIKMLREVLNLSPSLTSSEDKMLWKVTGRYIVRNITDIVNSSPCDADILIHCRNYPRTYVDFGLAGFRLSAARIIFDRILSEPTISTDDERVLRRVISCGAFEDFKIYQRFSYIPDFYGIRGLDNQSYANFPYRTKFAMRKLANRILPRLWI